MEWTSGVASPFPTEGETRVCWKSWRMATQLSGIVPCCFMLSGIQIVYLNPSNRSNVDDLRKFRNKEFAHIQRNHLFDRDFQRVILKVKLHSPHSVSSHSKSNKLPHREVRRSFKEGWRLETRTYGKEKGTSRKRQGTSWRRNKSGEKLEELHEKGQELQQKEEQRLALEEKLHSNVSPFCILPPKPSHDIAPRES